jgi:hypothetical protein
MASIHRFEELNSTWKVEFHFLIAIVESGKFGESTVKFVVDFEINSLDSSLIELKTYKVFQSLTR